MHWDANSVSMWHVARRHLHGQQSLCDCSVREDAL